MKKVIYVLLFLAFASLANAQWTVVNVGTTLDFTGIKLLPNQIYYATAVNETTGAGAMFKSTNGGTNWFQLTLPSNFKAPYAMDMNQNGLTGIVGGTSIIMTSNGGVNWSTLYTPPDTIVIFGMMVKGDAVPGVWAVGMKVNGSIYGPAIVRCANIMASTPIFRRISLPSSMSSYQLTSVYAFDSTTCYISVNGGGSPNHGRIIKTTNSGLNWSETITTNELWGIYVSSSSGMGFAVGGGTGNGGIYKTTDYGTSWNQIYTETTGLFGLSAGANFYAVGNSGKIIKGNYEGSFLTPLNSGTTQDLRAIKILDSDYNTVFAVGKNGIMLKTTNGGIGIKNISSEIPSSYSLSQNYPNPFNPSSIIRFQIKDSRLVTLRVYDMLGKEVATLVNEKLAPGTYEANFDGSNLTSGIYFYRLTTGDFSETKKMLMIK
jgi:photosystem II stability/assembly factor-like uncharacterized protein